MKENQEDEIVDRPYSDQPFDSEIADLSNLINTILDYYTTSQQEEGEEWKKGTNLEHKIIPEDIDELVAKVFKNQLKKFIKK